MKKDIHLANKKTRDVWDSNAVFWDEKMDKGNDFVNVHQWPGILRLLDPQPVPNHFTVSIL